MLKAGMRNISYVSLPDMLTAFFLEPEEVFHYGINTISKFDIQYAKEKGFKIKLVPYVGKNK